MNLAKRLLCVGLAVELSACAGGLPAVSAYDPAKKGGTKYCSDLEMAARTNSVGHRSAGWVVGALALAAAGAGAGVASTDQPGDSPGKNRYKVAVVTLPLGAALLGYLAAGQFSMADNSSALAAAAAAGANSADDEANATCNSALGTWNSDSASATAAFAAAVGKLNQANQAEKDAKIAKDELEKKKSEDTPEAAQPPAPPPESPKPPVPEPPAEPKP